MDLTSRLLVLLLVVVVVLVVGAGMSVLERRRRRTDFDFDFDAAAPGPGPDGALLVHPGGAAVPGLGALGDGAALVVVGTRGCSDCARTLASLRAGFDDDPTVTVHHVLAEQAPELVRRLGVRTAPTVLLADGAGLVRGIHPGAVDADVAAAALRAMRRGEVPFAPADGVAR